MFLINEVAHMVNLSQKRIREYETEGFIKPIREANTNNRLYSALEVSRIKQINSLIHDRGFTLAGLRQLIVHAPCWNIFGCPKKEQCPAYLAPWRPCYEVREDRQAGGFCSHCPIYLNREVKKEKIFDKIPFEYQPFLTSPSFLTPIADST